MIDALSALVVSAASTATAAGNVAAAGTAAAAAAGAPADIAFWSGPGLIALLTLAALEVVLGIDNVVFIAIVAGRLPEEKQARARQVGLLLAMVMRLLLLLAAFWIMKLDEPFATIPWLEIELSGKSLILLAGGLFLIAKATMELHHMVEDKGAHEHDPTTRPGIRKQAVSFGGVLVQILLLDLVFSIDSVVTAVGMTSNYWIMATAVVAAIGVMLVFAGPIADFVREHPTMKTLALAFLVLIGVLLVAEGAGQHLPRGYVYFSMVFALAVEMINMRAGHRRAAGAADRGPQAERIAPH